MSASASNEWLPLTVTTVDRFHCITNVWARGVVAFDSDHYAWVPLYFLPLQVTGMVCDVPYVFNIINFETPNSQFKHGMQPLLFSVKEAETSGRGWVRTGENVAYFTNKYKYHDVS